MLIYYEHLVNNPMDVLTQLYDFLQVNNKDKLDFVVRNMQEILNKTKELTFNTGGGYSNNLNFYSDKYEENKQENINYVKNKIKEKEIYNEFIGKFLI